MTNSLFFNGPEFYKRDFGFVKQAIEDYTTYLQKLTNHPRDKVKEVVNHLLKNDSELKLINPKVRYLERMENGDRELIEEHFSVFLDKIQKRNLILSPSMVAYDHTDDNPSELAISTEGRLGLRDSDKKKQKEADAIGDKIRYRFYHGSQTSRKVSVNSISGATLSPHNAYYNPSAHTSMTSNCRITTAYANANNERLLGGNRHFDTIAKAMENIVNVINLVNFDDVREAITEYSLHLPTADEMMVSVLRSTRMYVTSMDGEREIYRLVKSLSPIERAAWMYTGDLYHFAKYNDAFMRELIHETINPDYSVEVEDPEYVISNMPSSVFELASVIGQDLFVDHSQLNKSGDGPKTYSLKDLKKERPERYVDFAKVVVNICAAFIRRKSFINAFLKNDCAPAFVGYLPSMIRRVVLGSDTDSSMATGQHWTKWYTNSFKFDKLASKVLAVMVYFSSETLVHYLAMFSANVNVAKRHLYRTAMKNEFMYEVYIRSTASKHYYSNVKVCEGVIYHKPDFDVKGVQLIAGKLPKLMRTRLKSMQENILTTIGKGELIPLRKLLKEVASYEREILDGLENGDVSNLKWEKIKTKPEYSSPNTQTWFYHELWEEVFSEKYGAAPPPPYLGVSITIGLNNKTMFNEWVDNLEDYTMRRKIRELWKKANKKDELKRIVLPMDNVKEKGIPTELLPAISNREVVLKTMEPFYITLESIGYHLYRDEGNKITLACDYIV